MLPKQYTVAQVAEYFQRDEKTIRRWLAEGKFPQAYRVSDGWFILETDIKRLIRQSHDKKAGLENPASGSSRSGFVGGWK